MEGVLLIEAGRSI